MPHRVIVRGQKASILWGYHQAAALGTWTVTDGILEAAVEASNAFQIAQRPLVFMVPRLAGPAWAWKVERLELHGKTLTAALDVQS